MTDRATLGALGVCLGLAACGGGLAPGPGPDAALEAGADASAATPDAGAGDPTVLVGRFQVRLVAPSGSSAGYTTMMGKVYDGPSPSLIVWEPGTKQGSCQLFTPRVPFCSTPCGSAACVEDDTCQAYPTARSVGTVTVQGVQTSTGATTFSMEPVASNYQPAEELPFPAFAEGDLLQVSAAGAYYPAFTLQARGIAPLTLQAGDLTLAEGSALPLAWTPPATAGTSTVKVKLDISHHGGSRGKIECDAADTGALELSAALVTELLHLGVAGFPTIVVTRSAAAAGSATLPPGRVDLSIESEVEQEVLIPGLTSCNEDADCPANQTCQTDLRCQ